MKHSTPFENGKENGVIGDVSSWVHYNWPEAHISDHVENSCAGKC